MKETKCRGITLIEVIVVISIVMLLMSLAYPSIVGAMKAAKITRSMTQMHQIHAALMLYVGEQTEEGPLSLGLPPSLNTLRITYKLPRELFLTGGSPWKAPGYEAVYTWMPPQIVAPGQEVQVQLWKQYVARRNGNPAVILDETFSPETDTWSLKMAFGLFFDGHIEKRHTRGVLSLYDLWR